MGLKKSDRLVTMACVDCKEQNYTTERNKKKTEKLEKSKYCSRCKKHTSHKEIK